MITIDATERTFHLHNRFFSYAMHVFDGRFLTHLYWGDPLGEHAVVEPDLFIHPAAVPYLTVLPRGAEPSAGEWPLAPGGFSLDTLPQEFPVWGTGEQRRGAMEAVLSDGTEALRLEYRDHEVIEDACFPSGLPAVRSDHELGRGATLCVRLADPRGDLAVELYYVVYTDCATLFRWTRVHNAGTVGEAGSAGAVTIREIASAAVDLPPDRYDVVTLAGSWGRERHVVRTAAVPGRHVVESRGGASSHQTSPFLVVCDPDASETDGRVFSVSLMYSGNFSAAAAVDQYHSCRITIGLGGYRGHLKPGDTVDTPVATLVFSASGMGGMSDAYHHLVRRGIVASRWRRTPRSTVINSWEAMYFDVNARRITELARRGKEIGAELLILDDGWFSRRRDDTTSLGDWWVNRELFPDGLAPVAEAVRGEGLEFGLWLEPEMVSPESDLFRAHPEWCLAVPGREATLARNQLTLDLANPEVVEHLFETVSTVIRESTARYIKWDMNRAMSEAGSRAVAPERQGEVMHRYMLGLYRLLERLTTAFPEVLFEGCAGGGGRFDLGLARYSPRFWTSDDTDAVERLDIQYGTTLLFPPEMIGAHVSTVPNHQVGRSTPAWTRVVAAAAFSYGYELDPARESEANLEVFRRGSAIHRAVRAVVQTGRFVRLGTASGAGGACAPAAGRWDAGERPMIAGHGGGARAWMVESADGAELFVFYVRPLAHTNEDPGFLRVPVGAHMVGRSSGPDAAAGHADGDRSGRRDDVREPVYRDAESGRRYGAAQLRTHGLWIGLPTGDAYARLWHLVRES